MRSPPALPWIEVGAPGGPPYLNEWGRFQFDPLRFTRDGTDILIFGFARAGLYREPVFILPEGFRPEIELPLSDGNGLIRPSGEVVPFGFAAKTLWTPGLRLGG